MRILGLDGTIFPFLSPCSGTPKYATTPLTAPQVTTVLLFLLLGQDRMAIRIELLGFGVEREGDDLT